MAVGAGSKGVEIAYLMHPGVPERIGGDIGRLRQILLNLLSNAVKFTDIDGEVAVEVHSRASDQSGESQELEFAISDTGIGIQADQLERLFEPFSQAEPSTTRTYGGTGLGLSISKRLVERMGGRIWCESQPGRGSTFRFTVRVSAVAVVASEQDDVAAGSPLRGRRMLVVSDSAMTRRILSHHGDVWGLAMHWAASAEDGLIAADRSDFDIALIDLHATETAGQELASRLRAAHASSRIVLFGTSSMAAADQSAVSAMLPWPIKPMRLLDALKGLLNASGASADSVAVNGSEELLGKQHPLRILVVEDNPTNQYVARLMLSRMGYQADVVVNGQEAVAAVQRRVYDVVLMDVHMPVMDGLAATREICRLCRPGERPRIIGVSANAMSESSEQADLAGMDSYIAKPITPAALAAVLRDSVRLALESGAQR